MEEIEAADVEYTARRLADGSPYEYIFRDLDTIGADRSTLRSPSSDQLPTS